MRVGVVGCGLMGAGIAEVCARAGQDVIVVESTQERVDAGRDRIVSSLQRAQSKGKIEAAQPAIDRIRLTDDLNQLEDRELVIEAVVEHEPTKLDLFTRLDQVVKASDAILATNTSSIPVMKLATATQRPANVVGIHFFNPVPVLSLVEIVPSLLTSPETTRRAQDFAEQSLGKHAIRSPDRAGFIVNALLVPFILSAVRMVESGFATAEDVDEGLVRGAAHPQGPLRLADLIGLDTTAAIAQSLYAEFKEPLFAPPPLLNRMVEAGLLGRKSGRGFYEY
ncbi:3-hydroxybutyryl-CoA dehydrogenase [Kineosporia succinea]|uniref:3-hydroxybutyryl-CoA dehydrogenase n=1 Tax=Kineosporia succinea TaxID=84632 RepID=A0ABT9P074_9ACTN|nr:3-hydroxybutyryl-CoA dehydrogenase [Kineosporia succinea]MDP9825824.1 3-hydroxybutyryl-CoA dehydrogenase [Kineosporia succinea]